MSEERFRRSDFELKAHREDDKMVIDRMLFISLMNLAEDIQNRLDKEKRHSECLQAELEELQSEDIRNALPDEPIDVAAMIIHDGKYSLPDLQEIAEHLQAAYKNSWGE